MSFVEIYNDIELLENLVYILLRCWVGEFF